MARPRIESEVREEPRRTAAQTAGEPWQVQAERSALQDHRRQQRGRHRTHAPDLDARQPSPHDHGDDEGRRTQTAPRTHRRTHPAVADQYTRMLMDRRRQSGEDDSETMARMDAMHMAIHEVVESW